MRLVVKMEAVLGELTSSYDKLAGKLSEATVNPEEFDKPHASNFDKS